MLYKLINSLPTPTLTHTHTHSHIQYIFLSWRGSETLIRIEEVGIMFLVTLKISYADSLKGLW